MDSAAFSVASPPVCVSMKEWIVAAVNSIRSNNENGNNEQRDDKQNVNEIVCSREYISRALTIAHSIANQLSAVEEERGYKDKDKIPSSPSQYNNNNNNSNGGSPQTINKSWSEYILVYCMKRVREETSGENSINHQHDNEGEGPVDLDADFKPLPFDGGDNLGGHASADLDAVFEPLPFDGGDNLGGHASLDLDADFKPLPFDGGVNSEPDDLNKLAHQLSTLLEHKDNIQSIIDHLDVRVAILDEKAVDGRPLSANGKLEIRELGITLYELFSGGQITAKEGIMSQKLPVPQPSIPDQTTSLPLVQTRMEPCLGRDDSERSTKRRSENDISVDNAYHKTTVRMPSSSISVEPLKLLGLPTALCDLINNMIVSADEDAHDGVGETYEFISEVRDDLKLMIDSPNIYLRDIDLTKAANEGLQFGSSLFGREEELQTLKDCYQRSIASASECEVAVICGTSGIGKSELSREFLQSVKESGDGGSIFLSGRFDKLRSQPLHAISSAFDKYCAWLSSRDHSTAEKVAAALKENLGEEAASLVIAMPSLAKLLGDDFDFKQSSETDTAVDAQKRMRYLFCQFVEVISRCHDEHVILFLDDCQWIDDASVALLNQILIMSGPAVKGQSLFFFGSCRDDEMDETHPLNVMLNSVVSFAIKTTRIHLKPLGKGALNEMVSTSLSLLPRITCPLADIVHHKTKGSPLFVKQVMLELYKQRLLYPSLSRRRWVWETDKILDMKIPENVASFITKSFDRLQPEVLSALVVLSCFGASVDVTLIEVLEREIQQSLVSPLNDAVANSVLGKRNGEFYFMHDKLQEAAYSMMKPEERCLHHNRCGLALGFVAVRENDDRLLLTAVGQINHGGPQAVIDDEQAIVVAKLNLDAGKKALNMSDFFSAHSFFNHGISFLRGRYWYEHYGLSLELFNSAAKCALMNAEYDSFKTLTELVMHNAICFEDKAQAISNTISLLGWSGNGSEAIELIKDTLTKLGEGLPGIITTTVINNYLENTKAQLSVLSDEMLLSCPAMMDPSKIFAVELFVKLYKIMTAAGERAAILIIPLKVIQISLTHGMSPHSPVSFAQYGNYLALVRNEFGEGHRYVKVALSMMNTIPCRAQHGNIMFYANNTKLYVEPMQSAIEGFLDAYKAGMKSGNPYAIEIFFVYVNLCFWSGRELNVVVVSMKEAMKQAKYQKNLVCLTMLLPVFRMALRLMGHSIEAQHDDLVNAFGETFREDDITGKHAMNLHTLFFVRLSQALIFREIDEARDAAEKYFSIDQNSQFSSTMPSMFFRVFYSGLVSFWIGREMHDKKGKKWIARGVKCKNEIEKLAGSASEWNFQNKAYLLQAEEQFCGRNFEVAEQLYDAAILSSKTHKFVIEEALANELAGHFYLETGRRYKSVHYFSRAFDKYSGWGAVAKAKTLTQYFGLSGR